MKSLIDDNFLQYASYVIRDRAIPDLDDGLKPVQRRILFSLHENDDGKFIKVANIVGYCMQFHPHGDASIGDALVTLTNKLYMIEGQGNFGNILTGDPAAASRYIECRLTDLARKEIFNDELTKFVPTYDGRKKEPVTLPAKLPILLMLGAEGIAVGISTRVLPHNFCELIEAQIAILNKKSFKLFPDFPQGGLMDVTEYDRGNGRIRVRAVINKKDPQTLVIHEIPFGTTTESLIASIEDAARKKKIKIRAINDFTAGKVEIEVQLLPEEKADNTIAALYAFTQCEVPISSHVIVIHNNRPVEMNAEDILRHNTERLVQILKQELLLKQKQLLEELHRKTLVQIFVEHRIYKQIEECKTYPEVQQAVLQGVNKYRNLLRRDVTNDDVEMLLTVQIKRISLFDINKNRKDMDQIVVELEQIEKHLGGLIPYAIRYLKNLLKTYGEQYPRRTQMTTFEAIEVRELTARELTISYDREKGYLGYNVEGEALFQCSSYDKLILVWGNGRYKVIPPPEKLFVDTNVMYCAVSDRDKVMTVVYAEEQITYMKKFNFGGTILNKEYFCTAENAEVLLFSDQQPEDIFVRYAPRKGQQIHQQIFHTAKLAVRGAKTKGLQMTTKKIQTISTTKPRHWDDKSTAPRGAYMDFV
ncbi:MAG: DNA topoisomerase IV [Lentisphaerae bacterium GWF2_57_35]|nr:MAG: DNA topoisomerase IV [Lentisphaerae bacterium GWF2_57_35]